MIVMFTIRDNDYHDTCINLVDTISRVIIYHEGTKYPSESQVRQIIKKNLYPHYLMFQEKMLDSQSTRDYLESRLIVYFDLEALDKAARLSQSLDIGEPLSDHEYFYLDTDLNFNTIL